MKLHIKLKYFHIIVVILWKLKYNENLLFIKEIFRKGGRTNDIIRFDLAFDRVTFER